MELGKIPSKRLKKIIIDKIAYKRDDVLVHAGIGEDSAVVDLKDNLLVISSDPITGAVENAGYLAVHVACNDLAAAGAEPIGVQVVLLLPPEITDSDISELMEEIHKSSADIGVEILGGHTEVLSAVNQAIVSITAVGRVKPDKVVSSSGCKEGDDLVITKGVGIEGTYILANDYKDILIDKGISIDIIKEASKYDKFLSVIEEGKIGAELGVNAMHDVTEGGLYGALDELAHASGRGFKLDYDKLLIREETTVICKQLNIDPAGLISSGSMLIATSDGKKLAKKLAQKGIDSALIGKVTAEDKYVVKKGKTSSFQWSNKDELWSFMEQLTYNS